MGVLIDSSVLIAFERSENDLSDRLRGREEEAFFISVVTASELLNGVHQASSPAKKSKRSAFVETLLSSLPLLAIDITVARSHALLWAELTKSGKRIGVNDSWLAATCISHGLSLATRNTREFGQVQGLNIEEW